MLTNEKMTKFRFLIWHRARVRHRFITENLKAGRMVQITTATRAVRYTAKHLEMFKVNRTGCYVQRGKRWDCILGGCDIRAFDL